MLSEIDRTFVLIKNSNEFSWSRFPRFSNFSLFLQNVARIIFHSRIEEWKNISYTVETWLRVIL